MAMNICALIIAGLVSSVISFASATPGTATFYSSYTPSACYGNQNHGVMVVAASDPLWNNGAVCGKQFKVTCTGPTNAVPQPCTGKTVWVKVVDHCPGCGGTLDLSREAFATIANPVAGIVKIDYQQY
ncbi:putative EG45-like domain containing protein 1 [Cornus florida]|uniref:putative EG45-like domain containing protein 1 n=1 Tax=Cornus florida TaxID=4283 RepID=UPI00289FE08A|nr:putative EG45-like domain containing protein 1 [Cornus florida]